MSIIADTLKRLQDRSTGTTKDMAEEPSLQPTSNQTEQAGRHRKNSHMKFWIIGVGMAIGLGSLAFSAFWIGLHLDFGLSTNTHALMGNSRPIPTPPLPAEMQSTTQEPPETVVSDKPEIPQPPPPTPTSQTNKDHTVQTSLIVTKRSPTQDTSSTRTVMKSRPVVPPPETPVLIESPGQQADSTFGQSTNKAAKKDSRQIEPGESSPEKPPALKKSVRQPTPEEVEPQHIVKSDIEESKGPQTSNSVALPLKEESVEKFVKTAKLTTNTSQTPSSPTAMQKPGKAMNAEAQAPIPLQPSPAERLRHARQLIQAGQYEKAVTLLSPLFHDPPVKWQPWFWMGTALLGQEDFEQADQFFLSGLARNDKIPQLWIQRALVAQQRENYQLAIHELRQAESLEADIPHIHLNMGYAYERLGNDRLANRYYGKFLELSEGKPAFFSIRKKLFARLTQQIQTEKPLAPSTPSAMKPSLFTEWEY